DELPRGALGAMGYRAVSWRLGIAQLSQSFVNRARLLRDAIDGNQTAMANAIDLLSKDMAERERLAYERFEDALSEIYLRIAFVSLLSLAIAVLIGLAIAASIVRPLRVLMSTMDSIV